MEVKQKMVTVQTVTNDLTSRIGQMIDADGYFGSQCVDTVNHVAKTYFGTMLSGNAIDLLNSAKAKGWTVEYNKVGDLNSYPKEGWFFVMDTTKLYGHPYGHVGYVLKADAHKMETLETNVDGNADSLSVGGPLRKKTRDYYGVIGWFKPPYSNSPVPTQKGTVETKVVNGDVFSGLITDVDPNMMNANFDRKPIDRILIHHNAGTNDEAARRTWYKSTGVGTSAHYQITPDKTWGCVGENAVAFHAGNYEMNQRSIGIEHLNSTGAPSWLIAEETYKRSAKLIADISKRLNIPIDTEHVLPHRAISPSLCLPENYTELLTPKGWVLLKDIQVGDTIATYRLDDESIIFDEVYNKVDTHVKDTWKVRDVETTANHRMLWRLGKDGSPRITDLRNMLSQKGTLYIPNAGYFEGVGLNISDRFLQYTVAVQADGHYMYDNRYKSKSYYGIEFHLSKQRKIDLILDILDDLGKEYTYSKQSNGTSKIRVYGAKEVQEVEQYLDNKKFTWDFLNMSPKQAKLFLDYILDFDGCRSSKDYSSSNQQNIDVVQAIASLNGVGTRSSNDSKRLYFTKDSRTIYATGTIKDTAKQGYKRKVSCVSVNSGLILIRQHGRTTIVGNCPGGIDMAKLIRMANEEVNRKSTPVKEEPKNQTNSNSFKVRVKISNLRMRKEPTINSQSLGFVTKGVYTIVDTKTGDGHEWGKLKSGAGWIALKYTERL